MFADTITITVNSVAKVLTRVNQDGYSSEYLLRGATDEFRLTIRNNSFVDKTRGGKKIDRHTCQLIHNVYPVAPATVGTIRKAYTVFENEAVDGVTDPLNFDLGFIAFFTSANITKMLNWES
jgi:predicted nucleotide-binding protein (sugar kinase/HSP70/actin superfamily)